MRLALPEPEIKIGEEGFSDEKDWLDRKAFGQRLSNLFDALESPTVVALDGAWGSGKSHFLKLWAGAHRVQFNGQSQIVYFDAFREDFLDDPLVSLVAALVPTGETKSKLGKATKKLRRLALPLAKGGARIGLAVATAGATAAAEGVWDALAEATGVEAGKAVDAIDKLWARETSKRAAMDAFVETLREATKRDAEGGELNKLVVIVDELDRCRPDYALSLLETIKHFFAVDGVHFVLGVNLVELENSVKARYGAKCNAQNYLQKFVTLRVSLPETAPSENQFDGSTLGYFERVCERLGLPAFIAEMAQYWMKGLLKKQAVSLRHVERVASRLVLMATDRRCQNGPRTELLVCLHVIHVMRPNLIIQLKQKPLQNGLFDEVCELFDLREFRESDVAGDDWVSKRGYHLWLAAFGKISVHQQRQYIEAHMGGAFRFSPDALQLLLSEALDTWTLSP